MRRKQFADSNARVSGEIRRQNLNVVSAIETERQSYPRRR